jgi:type II secretion system protein N
MMGRFCGRHLGYVLFALLLLYLLVWWNFPCDQVRTAAVQSLEEVLPARVTVGKVSLGFPFYFRVDQVRLESGPLSLQLPDLDLVPQLLPFLRGQTAFKIADRQKLRRFWGEYQLKNDAGEMKIRLANLELKTQYEKDFSFVTKASGEAALQWFGEEFSKRNGQAWVLLERGQIQGGEGRQSPFPLTFIEKVRAEFRIERGVLSVSRLEVNGKDMTGSFPGGVLPDLGNFFHPPIK